MHDRPIYMRIDDSVVTMLREKPYLVRRARGFAPQQLRLARGWRKRQRIGGAGRAGRMPGITVPIGQIGPQAVSKARWTSPGMFLMLPCNAIN